MDKLKSDYDELIEAVEMKSGVEIDESRVESALEYVERAFPGEEFADMPRLVHLHQIYALLPSRTQVDRHVEALRARGRLFLFRFDSSALAGSRGTGETLICACDAYRYTYIDYFTIFSY